MLRPIVQGIKIGLVALLAVAVVAGAHQLFTYAVAHETPAAPNRPIAFAVTRDDTASSVAGRLETDRLIRSALLFKLHMEVARGDLQPGTYELRPGMSIPKIVAVLTGRAVLATPVAAASSPAAPAAAGALRILTVDATTRQPLPNACYTLQSGGAVLCDDARGDGDPRPGALLVTGLAPGSWTLTQTRSPAGYATAGPAQVEIAPGGAPDEVTITNWPATGTAAAIPSTQPAAAGVGALAIKTVNAQTGQPLPGACYELRDSGPAYCDDGGSGVISLSDVVAGERTVTQTKPPAGFQPAPPIQIDVAAGAAPITVTVKVQPVAQSATAPVTATTAATAAVPTIQPIGAAPLANTVDDVPPARG